jgi:hypothetical protein
MLEQAIKTVDKFFKLEDRSIVLMYDGFLLQTSIFEIYKILDKINHSSLFGEVWAQKPFSNQKHIQMLSDLDIDPLSFTNVPGEKEIDNSYIESLEELLKGNKKNDKFDASEIYK